ncbi:MAG: PcfJ domain-containing protein, partial [Prevotellaceae bacterium]|nr:PcfJ domain-containing protein [Prevotellaceae bacterium]
KDADFYSICATCVYPWRKILPVIKRNGYSKRLRDFNPTEVFRRLLNVPEFETVAKCNRFDIWQCMGEYELKRRWSQVKMLIRHSYTPYDFGIWKDTLRMAEELGLDTHSPKYVLPEDLKSVHDILDNRIRRIRQEEARRREREKIARNREYEKLFIKYNAALLKIWGYNYIATQELRRLRSRGRRYAPLRRDVLE